MGQTFLIKWEKEKGVEVIFPFSPRYKYISFLHYHTQTAKRMLWQKDLIFDVQIAWWYSYVFTIFHLFLAKLLYKHVCPSASELFAITLSAYFLHSLSPLVAHFLSFHLEKKYLISFLYSTKIYSLLFTLLLGLREISKMNLLSSSKHRNMFNLYLIFLERVKRGIRSK